MFSCSWAILGLFYYCFIVFSCTTLYCCMCGYCMSWCSFGCLVVTLVTVTFLTFFFVSPLRMYSYQSRVPPPPPPPPSMSRPVIPSKRPRVSLSGAVSRRTKGSSSSSKSGQKTSRPSECLLVILAPSEDAPVIFFKNFFFSWCYIHSEGGRSLLCQERAHTDQTESGQPAGKSRVHGKSDEQKFW